VQNYDQDYKGIAGVNYPENGIPFYQEDFSNAEEDVGAEIIDRETDFFSRGVISGFVVTASATAGCVDVSAGIARDGDGRRIQKNATSAFLIPDGQTVKLVVRHLWVYTNYLPDGAGEQKIRRSHSAEIAYIPESQSVTDREVALYLVSRSGSTVTVSTDLRNISKMSELNLPDHDSHHDDRFVRLTTAQTIAGVKTFSSIPVLPASGPTADNEAVRKAYVDNQIANHDSQHDDEIKAIAYPVGSFYIQFPDANSNDDATAFPTSKRPATLFGGTWAEQWSTENIFFKTRGTDGQSRSNGLSADQVQGHRHIAGPQVPYNSGTQNVYSYSEGGGAVGITGNEAYCSVGAGSVGLYAGYTGNPLSDGSNGTPRIGSITEPRNRLIKVWKRTA